MFGQYRMRVRFISASLHHFDGVSTFHTSGRIYGMPLAQSL